MKSLVPALAAATLLIGCRYSPAEPVVTVDDAVVTVPAVPGGAGAAYFTLETNNDPSKLVAITSPRIQTIELHRSRQENGRTQMEPLEPDQAILDPGKPLRFTPGGNHAMLMGMDPALKPGDTVELRFHVDPLREPVTVQAEVRGPGQAHANH